MLGIDFRVAPLPQPDSPHQHTRRLGHGFARNGPQQCRFFQSAGLDGLFGHAADHTDDFLDGQMPSKNSSSPNINARYCLLSSATGAADFFSSGCQLFRAGCVVLGGLVQRIDDRVELTHARRLLGGRSDDFPHQVTHLADVGHDFSHQPADFFGQVDTSAFHFANFLSGHLASFSQFARLGGHHRKNPGPIHPRGRLRWLRSVPANWFAGQCGPHRSPWLAVQQ